MRHKRGKPQSGWSFRLMSLEFKIRDKLRPPAEILAECGLRPGMTVLDFGCGPGGFSIAAAGQVGPEGLVYALDIHPMARESVRRAADRKGIGNLRTIDSGGLSEIPDGAADVALLYDVVHDLEEPAPVLAALHRVLRPAGFLSVADHHLDEAGIRTAVESGGRFRFKDRGKKTLRFEKMPAGAGPGRAGRRAEEPVE